MCEMCLLWHDNEDAGCILTFGHDEQRAPNGTRAMCGSCREYIDGYLRAKSPQKMCGRGSTVTAMQEWLEVLRLGHAIGNGKLKTKGWMPGSVVVRAEDERAQAKDFFPTEGNVMVGEDGVCRKQLSEEEKAKVAWRKKKRSLLLVDKFEVKRELIVRSEMLAEDAKARQLIDFDSQVVMQFQEMLDATGPRAVVADKGLEWRQKFVTSDSHSIEDERLMELELAHFAIVRLRRLLMEHVTDVGDEQQAQVKTTVAFTDAVEDRLCWGQTCVRRLAAGETRMGALRAGKEARAKIRSAWHVGLEHHVSIKKMELAEAKASADAEAEFMKKWKANANKPKPRKQPQAQPLQHGARSQKAQRNREKRKRKAEQRRQQKRANTQQQPQQQQKQPPPNVTFNRNSLKGKNGQASQDNRTCHSCGQTGHLQRNCPTKP